MSFVKDDGIGHILSIIKKKTTIKQQANTVFKMVITKQLSY